MTSTRITTLPMSHIVPVTNVSGQGREVAMVATETERLNIAEDYGLAALERLEARFTVTKGAGRLLAVQGHISASVTQSCGVSLKPVQEEVEADVALSYTLDPKALEPTEEGEVEVHPDDEDPPEPVEDGKIDFGAVALEHLVLNLNPYPRAEGVDFDAKTWQDGDEVSQNGKVNPFAALAGLKSPSNDP